MKITMITLGFDGRRAAIHAAGQELQRGHEVTIAAFAPFQGMIEENAGMSFYPISGDVVDMIRAAAPAGRGGRAVLEGV